MPKDKGFPRFRVWVIYLFILAALASFVILSCRSEPTDRPGEAEVLQEAIAPAGSYGEAAGADNSYFAEQAIETAPPSAIAPVFIKIEVAPSQAGRIDVIPAPNQGAGYKPGTHLVLEAVPASGFEFSAWAGDAGGTANRTQVTISSDLLVVAVFSKRAPEPLAIEPPPAFSPTPAVAPPSVAPPTIVAPPPSLAPPAPMVAPLPSPVAPPLPAVAPPASPVAPPLPAATKVVFNGVQLGPQVLDALEAQFGLIIEDGEYWYDRFSGAVGQRGGPMAAFIMPGLDLGGPLRADASGGGTGVYINGREAHPVDVLSLQMLVGFIPPGRYYLDAAGNYGYEGYENFPPAGNLIQAAQAARSGAGSGAGGGSGSAGGMEKTPFGYVGGGSFYDGATGCSVMPGAGVSC